MKNDHVEDVCSTVRSLVRIAAAVELDEVEVLCEASRNAGLQIFLLDPRHMPSSSAEHLQNRQLLEAFAQFRTRIEIIRRGHGAAGGHRCA